MVSDRTDFSESPGTLRPSQIVTTFGPGSVVQMEHDSVIVMGTDTWNTSDKYYEKINHPYLESLLDKDHFRMPRSVGKSRAISCRSFPVWGVCSNNRCRLLQRHKNAPPDGRRTFKCDECRYELLPAIFVMICEKGHLDEFPWIEWAHSEAKDSCSPNPKLRFRYRGNSPGLSDCYVKCDECGAERTCGRATYHDGLQGIVDSCKGSAPWLGDGRRKCVDVDGRPSQVYGIQTRSTSLYYPSVVTALYIPEWLHPIQKIITDKKGEVGALHDMLSYQEIAARSPLFSEARTRYGVAEIAAHLEKRFTLKRRLGKDSTELQIREKEYNDLMSSEFEGDENLEISESALDDGLKGHIGRLKKIDRITEVRVIRAFTRGSPPDPYSAENRAIHYCQISGRNTPWYPAMKNRGEGFLFTLNEKRLGEWENERGVVSRCDATIDAFKTWAVQKKWISHERLSPKYLLMHTLSHVMIREVANLSGYSEASIRERIYRGEETSGILLYTASPSSEGSLGGLVRQGEAPRFKKLLESAIWRSRHCSRDPLCADDDPVVKMQNRVPLQARLNGSACYACALLPETSCENVNHLLDRRLLFDDEFGFFSDMV